MEVEAKESNGVEVVMDFNGDDERRPGRPWALSPHIAQRKVHRYCTQRMAYHIHLIAYKLIQAARMEPNETDILHMEVLAQAMLGRS